MIQYEAGVRVKYSAQMYQRSIVGGQAGVPGGGASMPAGQAEELQRLEALKKIESDKKKTEMYKVGGEIFLSLLGSTLNGGNGNGN